MSILNSIQTNEFLAPIRTHSMKPVDIRVALYPDGSARVQGAYPWQSGWDQGVDWKDLPLVRVDANGQVIQA